jgi:starch synthase
MARLKILFAASECLSLAKVGGLGDVVSALPAALRGRGHDVRLLMPCYADLKQRSQPVAMAHGFALRLGSKRYRAGLRHLQLPNGVPVYLLEAPELYGREGVYGDSHGAYQDNAERFGVLSEAATRLAPAVAWTPDLIHVHDWPTALVPWLLQGRGDPTPTVLSIHNLGYQGRFDLDAMCLRFGAEARALACFGNANWLATGIRHATAIATVSPRYAVEIQTKAGGAGLHAELLRRGDSVVGILNGIDRAVWDPSNDPFLVAPFSAEDRGGKSDNKRALQRQLNLAVDSELPLFGLVSRLVHQKGIDVLAEALSDLLKLPLQLCVLGSGERWAEELFRKASESYPNFSAVVGYDEALAHRIVAGSDFFLLPSRYEPCGLGQLYAQRYGSLPIVRAVGGLDDTVRDNVTGFTFRPLAGGALVQAVTRALDCYHNHRAKRSAMQSRAMGLQSGWDAAAVQYDALYRLTLARSMGGQQHDQRP